MAPLGEEYVSRYRRFVSGGRIDVYENPGKRSGAYSAGVYGVGPYLLLNYNDTLDSVFTFAHETGHAMHTVLSYENQPFATSDYTIFVAEVASTTNERFLLEELLGRTSDPKERFLLLQHAADSIVGTYYTQVLFADFELQAHRLVERGQPITTEVLRKLYRDIARSYYGDAVTFDEFYEYTWARITHFYNSPYYVYQYATCFASSAQLFNAMTTGTPESRQGRDRALPDAAQERRQRSPDDAAEEGRRRPDAARDDPGGDRPARHPGHADGGRGGEDPLSAAHAEGLHPGACKPAGARRCHDLT